MLLPLALVSTGAGVMIAPDLATGLVLGAVAPLVWEAQSANALLRAQERFAQAATAQLLGRLGGLVLVVVLLLVVSPSWLCRSVSCRASRSRP